LNINLWLTFGRRFLLSRDGLAGPFSRSGVRTGALSADRKAPAVPKPTVTAYVHQPLDVHADICAKITFDGKFPVDYFTNAVELLFGEIADLFIEIDARFRAYLPRRRPADAENIRERYFAPFIVWYVNSCNTRQSTASLPIAGQLISDNTVIPAAACVWGSLSR
jgi:hypothetical protein